MGSFTGKELREVLRRPGVLASLVFGPFLIMFIFGLGYSGYRAPFVTEIVVPEKLPNESVVTVNVLFSAARCWLSALARSLRVPNTVTSAISHAEGSSG